MLRFQEWLLREGSQEATIKLVAQVEGNRWFVEFLDGEWEGATGDYRLLPDNFYSKGDKITVVIDRRALPPTVSHACGILTIK